MIKCKNCGRENPKSRTLCLYCGRIIRDEMVEIGKVIPEVMQELTPSPRPAGAA